VTTVTYYTLTHLYWLTSQLSITVSNYHTLYILTLRNSRRDLTPRIHLFKTSTTLVELLLNHWLLHSRSGNWTKPAKSSAYKPSIVLATRAVLRHRVYWCCLGNAAAWRVWHHCSCAEKMYSNTVVWHHCSCVEKTLPPLTTTQRVFRRELFSGRCLATLRCATQQLVDMSQYNNFFISLHVLLTCNEIKKLLHVLLTAHRGGGGVVCEYLL
jgi:hypothetical protein